MNLMFARFLTFALILVTVASLTLQTHIPHQLTLTNTQHTLLSVLTHSLKVNQDLCDQLTPQQRSLLFQRIQCTIDLHKQLLDLSRISEDEETVAVISNKIEQANNEYLYIKNNIIKTCHVTEVKTYFINIGVDNWVAGSGLTAYDVMQNYQQIMDDETVAVCPPETPFVVEGSHQCFNCDPSTPIFEYSSNTCISCPVGMELIGHVCTCPSGQYYDSQEDYCVVKTVWERPHQIDPVAINPIVTNVQVSKPVELDPITYTPEAIEPTIVPHVESEPVVVTPKQNSEEEEEDEEIEVSTEIQIQLPPGTQVKDEQVQEQGQDQILVQAETSVQSDEEQQAEQPAQQDQIAIQENEADKEEIVLDASFMIRPSSSNPSAIDRIILEDIANLEGTNSFCHEDIPFFTGNEPYLCISCPKYFNWETKECAQCPSGTSLVDHQCL